MVTQKQWPYVLLVNLIFVWNFYGITCISSNISFQELFYLSEEKPLAVVSLTLRREDISDEHIFFTCNLPPDASKDFNSTVVPSSFGPNEWTAKCDFIITDDNIPEGNETFPVSIEIRNNKTVLRNISYITILLNDDPHGFIGFTQPGISIITEEPIGVSPTSIQFNLTRHGGNIGAVSVLWEIIQTFDILYPDIQPYKGTVNFTIGQGHSVLDIHILPDRIPELIEIYTIRLVSTFGGASILLNSSEVEIRIQENDAPLRFRDSEITFTEPETKKITIYRGLNTNYDRVGPTSDEARVNYETVDGTAIAGKDYVSKQGEIIFESGTTAKEIDIQILKDPKPELRETFIVRLLNPSVNVILSNSSELRVFIAQNGDPYGVVSFNTSNVHNNTMVMDEDNGKNILHISIIRTSGTFGNLSVTWMLENVSGGIFSPFVETTGDVIFVTGHATINVTIEIKQDDIANIPTFFALNLTSVSGGGRLKIENGKSPSIKVLVMDSDNAYGVIEFMGGPTSLILSMTPRCFNVQIERSGRAYGVVDVYYDIKYFYQDRSRVISSVLDADNGIVTFHAGQNSQRIYGEIRNNVFLKINSYFIITLEKVVLQDKRFPATSSPVLGPFKTQCVNITSDLANGEIGFFNSPLKTTICEPLNVTEYRSVLLELMRDGRSAVATVFWKVTSTNSLFTMQDVYPMEGNVTFQQGVNNATVFINIVADGIPELNEEFIVELTRVIGENERLRSGATKASVTILENDNPEGTFQFNSSDDVSLMETSSRTVNVIRHGGSLKRQTVYVEIVNGNDDFKPFTSLILFSAGDTFKPMYLFPIEDDFPEINETFLVQLSSSSGAVMGIITSFNVTILANDDPYGVIAFASSSTNMNQRISELRDREAQVSFHVSRIKGLFKHITVFWNVSGTNSKLNASEQLRFTSGSVVIAENLNSAIITLRILKDSLPEEDQEFIVSITNITGGATLSEPSKAQLIILANDFPVTITPHKTVAHEGETVKLTVQIPVSLSYDVQVTLQSKNITALQDDFVVIKKDISIPSGMTSVFVNVVVIDDDLPELEECFVVFVESSTGDTVLQRNLTSEICIQPSDDPGGVFVFNNHQIDRVREGDQIQIIVNRQQGSIGKVILEWKAEDLEGNLISKDELSQISGDLSFKEGQKNAMLSLVVSQDHDPELNEFVVLYLYNVSGDYATIGKTSKLNISIAPSDHPNGLFIINQQSSHTIFAEDFDGENRQNTTGTVLVKRIMGSLFQAKLLWVITPINFGDESVQLLDLLLHSNANFTDEIKEVDSNSGTKAMEFNEGSFLKISNETQAMAYFDEEFTLRFSIKTNARKKMQVLEVLSDDGSKQLGIAVDSRSLNMEFFTTNVVKVLIVRIPTFLNDDNWHDIIISVQNMRQMDVYVDGKHIERHTSVEPDIPSHGDIYVGGRNASSGFVGLLKNVWLYSIGFNKSEIEDDIRLSKRFNKTNGHLTFEKGETSKEVVVSTIDNNTPQPQMDYVIHLADLVDDREDKDEMARISGNEATLAITVLKSDFANGIFRLSSNRCTIALHEIQNKQSIVLERYHSFIGGVNLSWEIIDVNGQLATPEFVAANGTVMFVDGEKQKNILISPFDDSIPERNESFVFRLTTAASTDGQLELSTHSGVSIATPNTRCNITIVSNDNPNGVLVLTSFVPTSSGYITVRKMSGSYNVSEETSLLALYVVRTQGTDGQVSVEWKTVANGTAVGDKDFLEDIGSVTLQDGERSVMFTINIIDNVVPELAKSFSVVLKNPTGGAIVTDISLIRINIVPSDGALGVFYLVEKKVFVDEGSMVNITVRRAMGSLGGVWLHWVVMNGSSDFVEMNGTVMFDKGVHERIISIIVIEEEIPEEAENFLLMLTDTTGGAINSTHRATEIIVNPNDHPYGLFEFKSVSVKTIESQGNVSLGIVRSKGKHGQVRVVYQTTTLSHIHNMIAIQDEDYMYANGSVIFLEDEIEKVITVAIIEDDFPESNEMFAANITSAELLQPINNFSINSMIGNIQQTVVTIVKNDDSNGVLRFDRSVVNITEDHVGGILTVFRTRGTFGKISFSFSISEATATIGVDYTVKTFTVSMEEGEQNVSLPIFMIPDGLPEFTESIQVTLLTNTVIGGARLGKLVTCRVHVLENDHPYGIIGIENTRPLDLNEPEGNVPSRVSVKLLRQWGDIGIVKVQWKIIPLSSKWDLSRIVGEVGFLTGEKEKEIYIDILPDDVPELDETMTLQLTGITEGKASIDPTRDIISLVILENDNPFGVVMFKEQNVTVNEENGTIRTPLQIDRSGGLFGDIKVFYRTVEISASSGHRRADGNSDYKEVLDSYVIIKNGTSHGVISIVVYDDVIAELDEHFQVAITVVKTTVNVTGNQFPMIGANNQVHVIIEKNDYPYGLFRISLDNSFSSGNHNKVNIVEPTEENVPVQFHINREFGTFGTVTISWRISNGFTITPGLDITGSSGENVTFASGEVRKSFSIMINSDDIPEDDEMFSLEVYNTSGGAQIDNIHRSVKIVIRANDDAGGVIGFQEGSLSKMVQEGDTFTMYVQRTAPALGRASVTWKVQGDGNATQDFLNSQGVVEFQASQILANIKLTVRTDVIPEINEKFLVNLTSVSSSGIDISGAAVLDQTASIAYLFVGASNNPHGLLEFYNVRQPVLASENDGEVAIRVARQFGTLGQLELFYEIATVPMNDIFIKVDIQDDVGVTKSSVILQNGADSVQMTIPIVNDDLPEVDETFYVTLVSVQLLGSKDNTSVPPVIGKMNRLRVVIAANDGARGELSFDEKSLNPFVNEKHHAFNLTVTRSRGTFGRVFCFYFLNLLNASKNDFKIKGGVMNGGPAKLLFADGQRSANITVIIFDDNETEDLEQFEVGLTIKNAVRNGGVTVSIPTRTLVSIRANDDANGVVIFNLNSREVVLAEPSTDAKSAASQFTVDRLAGAFGEIVVGWQVVNGSTSTDVSPLNGILRFSPFNRRQTFQLKIVNDEIPELEKRLNIQLVVISGDAKVGIYSTAMLIIPANDNPHGIFSFEQSVIHADESIKLLKLSVIRKDGLFGTVTVDYNTQDGTAKSFPGNTSMFGVENIFTVLKFRCSHSFQLEEEMYLIVISDHHSTLYVWRGVFREVKVLSFMKADFVESIEYKSKINDTNTRLIAASNTTQITIFMFQASYLTLVNIQTIAVYGVTDVLLTQLSGNVYLIVSVGLSKTGDINKLKLFKWSKHRFVETLSLFQTFYGKTMDITHGGAKVLYLAVGNYYHSIRNSHQTDSYIYQWSNEQNEFRYYGIIETNGVLQLKFFEINNNLFIAVANERSACEIYIHDSRISVRFRKHQSFNDTCKSLSVFTQENNVYLVMVSKSTYLYSFDRQTKLFLYQLILPYVGITYYDIIQLSTQPLLLFYQNSSKLFQLVYLYKINGTSDYLHRNGQLTFDENENKFSFYITIIKDAEPEDDETFLIILSNPNYGAVVSSTKGSLEVVIMANDNAFGRIGFTNSSCHKFIVEEDHDIAFELIVMREFGSSREVTVWYSVNRTSTESVQGEIYPTKGELTIPDGQRYQTLILYLTGDKQPEITETFHVSLTAIQTKGVGERGATINYLHSTSEVKVLPNDHPYGVFQWQSSLLVTTEELERNSSALLVLQRKEGVFGDVVIRYETVVASRVGSRERAARPNVDFTPKHGNVIIHEGTDETYVFITINHKSMEDKHINDGDVAFNEIFYVNITSVHLFDDNYSPSYVLPIIKQNKRLLQVVITDIVQQSGIVEFALSDTVSVDEDVGIVNLPVVRHNGTNGSVGVYFELFYTRDLTPSDVTPRSGTVSFAANQTVGAIKLSLLDDNIPELTESFVVLMTKSVGGAIIGKEDRITVRINENDFPYGLFSIQSNISRVLTEEGKMVHFVINRQYGSNGVIEVNWSCNHSFSTDISNFDGKLIFARGERSKNFQFLVLDDDEPEMQEDFSCQLDSVSSPAWLGSNRVVNVSIAASDKPYGEFSIDVNSRNLIVGEPTNDRYDGKFNISVLRSAGQTGRSAVSWEIIALRNQQNNTAQTFSITSGTIVFENGIREKKIEIQVIDDIVAEESQQYLFKLSSPTNGDVLSPTRNFTEILLTVASSDHPYGVFSVMRRRMLIEESDGSFTVIVQREDGLIGDVEISYAVVGKQNEEDIVPSTGKIIFATGNQVMSLTFTVTDDPTPELDETYMIILTSADLLHINIDFEQTNGILHVNTPPILKVNEIFMNVTVVENDYPYGLIGFESGKVICHEWQSIVHIPVVRNGGTSGVVNVSFSYTSISATLFTDFKIDETQVFFNDGQNVSFIEVTLIDDSLPEQQESFDIDLHSINNGQAKISNHSQLTFIIETSDNPSGLFGVFNMSSTIEIQNPLADQMLEFPISRLAGTSGEIQVTWEIVRTVSSASLVSEDLSPSVGIVTFDDRQSRSVVVRVRTLPYGGPQEGEERFHFTVKQVTGGAAIDENASKILIVIKKKGYPNGLFYISGIIEPSSIIDEPTDKNETLLRIHVNRAFGRIGTVKVRWSVTSRVGDLLTDIRFNQSQTISFAVNQVDSLISMHVINDNIPELDEQFYVKLLTADLEGEVDESRDRISFTIRANDDPYGVFYLPSNEQTFHLNSSTLKRSLHVTVARSQGAFEACTASVLVTHTELPPMQMDVDIYSHQTRQLAVLQILESIFLPSGSSYTVRIVSVSLKSTNTSLLRPTKDKLRSTQTIKVPQIGANSLVEVKASSRYAVINPVTQMVTVTISRTGLYGTITVSWHSGYPKTVIKSSTAIGLLSPAQGSITIGHGSRTDTISFEVISPQTVDRSYDYSVYLSADDIRPRPNEKGWPKLGTNIYSVVEPHGIVNVAPKSRNVIALEGTTADISIIRLYNTVGTIRVTYQTRIHTGNNPAIPSKDFVPMTSYVDFLGGDYEKTISIEILDDVIDPKPEIEESFSVELVSVSVLSTSYHVRSPRFGKYKISNVTIQDDDNPFGTISFTPASRVVSIDESSGFVEFTIQRNGGMFSASTVEIVTLGGGEGWTQEIIGKQLPTSPLMIKLQQIANPASAASDYVPFRKNVIFQKRLWSAESTQKQKLKVDLYSDDIAEPMEEFLVLISNATGGAIIFQPHSFATVSIKPNGIYNGLVRFETINAVLDEDGEGQVQIAVLREGTVSEQISVIWVVHSSNREQLNNQLEETTGTINMTAGNSKAFITLTAVRDVKPEFAVWFFVNLTSVTSGAIIKNSMNAVNVTMLESDYPSGNIAFDVTSRYPVVQLGENEVELVVRRFNGSMNDVQVGFSTHPLAGVTRDGGILMNPAIQGTDFLKTDGVLSFSNGQTKSFVKVRLLIDQSTTISYPKIFNVTLQDPSSGAVLSPSYKSSRIIISNKKTTGEFLKLRSDLLSVPLSDPRILEILTKMYKDIQQELTEDEHQLSSSTISAILDFKSSQPTSQKVLTPRAKDLLLNIFNVLMSASRSDTKGYSYWMKLFEKTIFALTNDWICPTKDIFSRSNFDVTVERQNKSKLNGASFGSDGDYFRYPFNMYSDAEGVSCTDIQYVDLKSAHWFSGVNSVLNNKVLSTSVRSGTLGGSKKVVFRVNAPQNRITPTGVSCVIWDYPTSPSAEGSWSSKNCKIRTEAQKYVECECDHMSEYAILAQSDDRTGYEIYLFVACFVTIGACFLALVSHHLCAIDKTFPSKLLMHTFFAVMLTNIIYVIDAYFSPRLINQPERCSVLGIFLHFAFLTQFTTIFVQVCNLWKILILNDEHSYRKAITFYIISWGLPILIIVGYFFITHAVWDWSLSKMYGDVRGNGDLCFIPHAYAAFSVAVIPILLFMLAVGVVFVQAYQVTPQWKCYDDIYRGRYNIKEVRHLMILFAFVTLTWLFGGLHIAFGHLWMAISFTFFNVFAGLYVLLVYVILRNQMRYVFRGKYDFNKPMDNMKLPHTMYQSANDIINNGETNDWDVADGARTTPLSIEQQMRRSATPMSYQSPCQGHREPSTFRRRPTADDRKTPMNTSHNCLMNESHNNNDDDIDGVEFDDLIFALKSGGNFTPSIHEGIQSDPDNFDEDDDETFPEPPPSSERYSAVRRIKMGDTPL